MNSMAKCLLAICKDVKEILFKEDRLLRISAPCYVLGSKIMQICEYVNPRLVTLNYKLEKATYMAILKI
jgi:hypothetical protein